jgi:hypothetical protein
MKGSEKKIKANRKNAKNSCGPKTKAGKRISSHNSLKHGLFARELIISEAEKAEVGFLRRALYAELVPKTALQNIAFDEVVCCTWRVKLAARLEMRRTAALFDASDGRETQPEVPEGTSAMPNWYLSGRQDLRYAIRFLENVSGDFEANGLVRQEWKDPLDGAFGVGFYDLLTNWTPVNRDVVLLAQHLVKHSETFGRPLPPMDGKSAEVVIDPEQGHQMVEKLIELKLQDLRGLSASWAQRASKP